MSHALTRKLREAEQRLRSGDAQAAQALCEQVLGRAPRNPDAAFLLAMAHLAQRRADAAIDILQRVVEVDARHGAAWEHLGLALLMVGRFDAAERALLQASGLPGAPPNVFMRLGLAILEQGRANEAVQALEKVAALVPRDADAQLNLGRAYAGVEDYAAASRCFRAALELAPDRPEPCFNLGLLAARRNDFEDARQWLERALARDPADPHALGEIARVALLQGRVPEARRRFEAALAAAPAFAPAQQGLGGIALSEGKIGEAIQRLAAALRIEPRNANASAMLAAAFFEAGELDQAAVQARHALACDSTQAATYATLANLHFVRSELQEAIAVLEDGYAHTRSSLLLGTLAYHLRHACEWERGRQVWLEIEPLLETSDDLGSPFWLLCQPTTPEQQLAYARRSALGRFRSHATSMPAPPPPLRDRLRIGYLSSDFQQHAVAYLIAEVLEEHDRDRFEIFAYSYGPEDGGTMRPRLRAACEHFVDIARVSEDAAAERIRTDALDLLIDLKGYTAGERLGILARRPCATQLTWLGYPGTTGAAFIDYVIVDPVLVPAEAERHYSERILRLPHCYQPNDRKRTIAPTQSRSAYGLPENGFVFCCFNQTYKITPEVFAIWMRLLEKVQGSVLWLFESQPLAAGNLQRAARAQGVDPARIVFAPRLPNAEHLARYRAADLALDTFPYTSHTTLSDALWCGCPGVVLCGETFAARVSASIAMTAGMPEIVTHSLEEYERLVCELALEPRRLQALRTRVREARECSPLFDSVAFARDLESLYTKLVAQSRSTP